MDIRYSTGPQDVQRYTTEELRKEFLIENLYQPDQVTAVYSHVDRMVVLGIMPVDKTVPIDQGIDVWANFGTHYFLERREAGTFNLGGPGVIVADGTAYELDFEDCLYITKETKEVTFQSKAPKILPGSTWFPPPPTRFARPPLSPSRTPTNAPAETTPPATSGSSTSLFTPMCWRPASCAWV